MSSMTRSALGTVFVLIITFCLCFIVSKKTERMGGIDLTGDQLYTLTDGSKAIVDKLQKPLALNLFYAKQGVNEVGRDFLLQFNNLYFYVRDLLRAYERYSGGRVTLEEFDPRPFSDAEVEADRLRLQRFPMTRDGKEGFYFGLAITSESGAQETIPFFSPDQQSQIEYQISEAIELASGRKKTKIGVLSPLEITGGGMSPYMRQMMQMQGRPAPQPWFVAQQLEKFYELETIATDADEIGPDIGYLLIVHPKELGEKTLYAIDQFVMRGGKALVFVDPYCLFDDNAPPNPQNPMAGMSRDKSSDLNRLLETWGVTLEKGQFAGDLNLAQRVGQRQQSRFVGVMQFQEGQIAQDEVVTQDLRQIDVWFPGALNVLPDAGSTVTPLIQTTPRGNLWKAETWELGGPQGPDVASLSRKFSPGSETLVFAAKISGKLKSAFDGPIADPAAEEGEGDEGEDPAAAEEPEETPAPHLAEAADGAALIVVADVDLIADQGAYARSLIGVMARNDNATLLLNSLDHLAGSADLISIRSRGRFERPFTVVDEIEREADARSFEEVKRIEDAKSRFETELRELQSQATTENVGLLQNEAIKKQRELEAEIRALERQQRELQLSKLEAIESLGFWVKNTNRVFVPMIVLLVGVLLAYSRYNQRRARVTGGKA